MFVGAIAAMAHRLKLEVIAKGVGPAEQRAFLRACGCDYIQVYYFGRLMVAKAFA